MSTIDFRNIRYLYCLDNGNGNIMAYRVNLQVSPEKRTREPLLNPEGEPAGYALNADGKMQLGKQLEGTDYSSYARCKLMQVNFKSIPTEENRKLMVQYLKGWLERIRRNCPDMSSDGKDGVWLIGCPNGWKSRKTVDAYRDIFLEAGFVNPVIVPESNAALAHFLTSHEGTEVADLENGVLCCDVGAYSVDATYIQPGKVVSEGSFVGACLIEQMIINANLTAEQNYRSEKNPYNSPALTEAVRKRFETDPVFRSFMLLQGRWLKEQYFTKKNNQTLPGYGRDLLAKVYLDDDPSFSAEAFYTLFINTKMVEKLVKAVPVRAAMGKVQFDLLSAESREEIGDSTWIACFTNFLGRLTERIPAFGEQLQNGPAPVVVLTGGASQMDLIATAVDEVYDRVRVMPDRTPVLAIAMGLTDFGPDKLRAMAVNQAVLDIVDKQVMNEFDQTFNQFEEWCADAWDHFCNPICSAFANAQSEWLREAVMFWATGSCASGQIGAYAKMLFRSVFDHDIVPLVEQYQKEANEMLENNINEEFQRLLSGSDFGITALFEPGDLRLKTMEDMVKELLPEIENMGQEAFMNMQKEFLDGLPNPEGYTIFGSVRLQIYRNIEKDLDVFLEKWQEITDWKLRDILYDDHWWMKFWAQCQKAIMAIKEKRKSTILRDLIVEEAWDEEEKPV